jgi:hypothetical protein
VEKGQAASCRVISWLGGRSRKVRKVGKVASRCRTNQRLEGSAAARRGRCRGGDERDGAREGETRGTSHRLSGGRGRAARRVVAGASIEAGVTKCVRVCWERQRGVQRTKGRAAGYLSLRRSRVVHLSTILTSFILRTFLVSYSGVLENLGKAFKLVYAKPLRWTA